MRTIYNIIKDIIVIFCTIINILMLFIIEALDSWRVDRALNRAQASIDKHKTNSE